MKLASAIRSSLKVPYTEPSAGGQLTDRLVRLMSGLAPDRRIVIVCVGTDRSTGDALGPLVGSALERFRSPLFDLYGTLEEPVHAMNLGDTLQRLQRKFRHPFVIGIDACLGQAASVGCIQIGEGPVHPGAGVNKELPPVGDIHITGIVNVSGFMEYFVLQNTRLHLVMRMADTIANSLFKSVLLTASPPIAAVQPD